MIWQGKELKTMGDIMAAVNEIVEIEDENAREVAAEEFMGIYEKENPHAYENIGYMSGYYTAEEAKKLQELFAAEHPYFGWTIPTAADAFDAGREWVRDASFMMNLQYADEATDA